MLHTVRPKSSFLKCKQSFPSSCFMCFTSPFLPLIIVIRRSSSLCLDEFSASDSVTVTVSVPFTSVLRDCSNTRFNCCHQSTSAGFTQGAAVHGGCSLRERPSSSIGTPAGRWAAEWRASVSASSSMAPRSWPQLRQRPGGRPSGPGAHWWVSPGGSGPWRSPAPPAAPPAAAAAAAPS